MQQQLVEDFLKILHGEYSTQHCKVEEVSDDNECVVEIPNESPKPSIPVKEDLHSLNID